MPKQQEKNDVLGIISLAICVFLPLIGLVLGLIGAHLAKKEGRSVALSRAAWLINLVFLMVYTSWLVFFFFILHEYSKMGPLTG